MKYLLANWKANCPEPNEWVREITNYPAFAKATAGEANPKNETAIIIAAPYTVLGELKRAITTLGLGEFLHIAAQDVSRFPNGAYTGEVTAEMLNGLAEYVLIGHNERRKYFQETEEIIAEKIKMALMVGLKPVVCVADENEAYNVYNNYKHYNDYKPIFLYEPFGAIGTGQTESVENVAETAKKIKEKCVGTKILYGGSVNAENALGFWQVMELDGVGAGKASVDAKEFGKIIEKISNES